MAGAAPARDSAAGVSYKHTLDGARGKLSDEQVLASVLAVAFFPPFTAGSRKRHRGGGRFLDWSHVERGIGAVFWDDKPAEAAAILPLVRPG